MSIKFVAGLLIGAAAGVVLANLLNSEEGKEILENLKKDAADVEQELAGMAEDLVKKGREFVDSLAPDPAG